ncbi:MAG: amino acid permease, partial [Lachnospiraceae bacterium]|nr:amino acid permease [Lachnospiraceae bacterium]
MNKDKKMMWYTLAFMAFSTVWGFGNVVNGFVYFNGNQVIFSWILMFALYFVPYALMVGELGSAFKTSGGGVSSWIHATLGPKFAYYAGWTYWACHITYISSKSSGGLKALSWAIFRNAETYDSFKTIYVQLASLAILLIFGYIASRGLNPLKSLATIAGTSMFVMSILFILMMFAAPAINPQATYVAADTSMKALLPEFNVKYFTSLSILVFAVGGCEKISPYVNKVENPSKG